MLGKRFISTLLAIGFTTSFVVPTCTTVAFADQTNSLSTNVQATDENGKLQKIADTYKGTNLLATNFDRSIMTDKEEAFFDTILELEYSRALKDGSTYNLSKVEFKDSLEKLLYQMMSNTALDHSNPLLLSIAYKSNNPEHGLISTSVAAATFNVIINTTIFAMGMPSLGAMKAALGKEAAELVVKETLIPALESGAKTLGLKSIAKFFTAQVVEEVLNAFIDPGGTLAELIDHNDLIPDNKYIELT